MAIKSVKAKAAGEGEGNFERPSARQHKAVLVAVIDLGTQQINYQGQLSKKQKVYLGWELLEERRKDGTPFLLGNDYSLSFAANGNLRPLVEGWLGKTFKDGEDYDITPPASKGGLLGRYCLLTVVHETSKANREFAKIKSVTAVPEEMRAGAYKLRPVTTPFVWQIEERGVPTLVEQLYLFGSKLSDHIAAAEERRGKGAPGPTPAQAPAHGDMVVGPADVIAAAEANYADEIPF